MKKTLSFLLLLLFSVQLYAGNNQTAIILNGKGGNRSDLPLNFDMPLAFYVYGPKVQDIIIDGGGIVSYYDVEISSPVTNTVEMATQVDGTYDCFDISSLPTGSHVITIESPSGNIYEGTFTKY